jgi:hypothetical protein
MKLMSLITRGASASGLLTVSAAVSHLLAAIAIGSALLALLVFFGVALPAVWSSRPARRRAAADVLGLILAALRHCRK